MNHHGTPPGEGALFGMTDLEEALAGENRALVLSSLLSRLTHLGSEIDASVRAGLTPGDFSRAQALGKALRAARSLLETLPSD